MSSFGQVQQRPAPAGRARLHEQLGDLPAVRVIPYDYEADFRLTGQPGNLLQDVINISVEGVFVAVSVGYAFDENRAEQLDLVGAPVNLGDVTLQNIPPDVLIEGFRINPDFAAVALKGDALNSNVPLNTVPGIFQRLARTENFGFMLSIVDTGTGRELQNEPVHSVATLGGADGRRPFKMLSQPMVFMPRSTIRIQIEERTAAPARPDGFFGRLFITLQGYKILGVAGAMPEAVNRLGEFDPLKKIPVYDHESGTYRPLGEAIQRDIPSTSVVPFDYVSTLDLQGRPGNVIEDEIPVNVDGGYATTAIGYSLDAGDNSATVALNDLNSTATQVLLSLVKLADFTPAQALLDGIRIHPLRVRFAFNAGGQLANVAKQIIGRLFQRLNLPEDVRFLFSISDSGTGRDLQNQRLHNVAALGIANGDRPFRVWHKPMMFLPRSTIRVQVEEIFGRGRLFIVFQGYKILTPSGRPAAGR